MATATLPQPDSAAPALAALRLRFGDRLQTGDAIRAQHSAIEGMIGGGDPDAVLFATSTEDVAAAVAICAEHRLPVIAHGAGSSLEGQLAAPQGGLSIDLTAMNRVLEVNAGDLDVRVEAGVTREALNAELKSHGLFFPLDPGANATLGGMAATRASGTNAVRYGTMREVTLGLTVVTATGEVIRTGGRARKSAAGYDLTRIFVGSEGTLGIITELSLRVFGIPEEIASAVVQFDELPPAVEAVMLMMQMALPLARIELLDAVQMGACIAYSGLDEFAAKPTLFMEFHGSPAAVAEQVETVRAVVADFGGGELRFATLTEDRNRLWKARHNAWFAAKALRPGAEAFATDACVPISRLAEAIAAAKAAADEAGLIAPLVGHVGDGNFHMLLLFDPNSEAERGRAHALSDTVARIAIGCGGTATGEHGIGLHKLSTMAEEHGEGALLVMASIKRALDPLGILNPGKTVPAMA
ncbi:FAD-binding oxidoreductase [Erythrobacter sp. WG]|uniref:FAD-binding oxidoreductase n=1 Tax=Erythrobacter sp. WG TaxID=2985510 RepID=UPI00226E416F|nr:FAD-linked oxidase C-terminal domain-containing protein [Erythrobacter sp. WG]MCX9148491.1 FAD-binding protein [Erythrobacter sp. WG]